MSSCTLPAESEKKMIIIINYCYIIRYMYTAAFLLMPDPSFNTKLSSMLFRVNVKCKNLDVI